MERRLEKARGRAARKRPTISRKGKIIIYTNYDEGKVLTVSRLFQGLSAHSPLRTRCFLALSYLPSDFFWGHPQLVL